MLDDNEEQIMTIQTLIQSWKFQHIHTEEPSTDGFMHQPISQKVNSSAYSHWGSSFYVWESTSGRRRERSLGIKTPNIFTCIKITWVADKFPKEGSGVNEMHGNYFIFLTTAQSPLF